MPMKIEYVDYYLEQNKHDVFYLQLVSQGKYPWDFESISTGRIDTNILKQHLLWLDEHGVKYAMICDIGWMSGDTGMYYQGFDNWNDPRLKEYCAKFEDENGNSKDPTKYLLCYRSYEEWLNSGKRDKYLQHLKDLEDPDYEW